MHIHTHARISFSLCLYLHRMAHTARSAHRTRTSGPCVLCAVGVDMCVSYIPLADVQAPPSASAQPFLNGIICAGVFSVDYTLSKSTPGPQPRPRVPQAQPGAKSQALSNQQAQPPGNPEAQVSRYSADRPMVIWARVSGPTSVDTGNAPPFGL
jgi:hypothetical protein